ncbi:hypothetical protein MAR_010107 [Mya arenaria]|uniref:Uncharacterized protein n=1 Tax=Mya arenaria TaxID=6604 RepID=A0ABY7E2W1_MYAAR|nr:hypothetical protein MAR_010107 [Mya arenaria]
MATTMESPTRPQVKMITTMESPTRHRVNMVSTMELKIITGFANSRRRTVMKFRRRWLSLLQWLLFTEVIDTGVKFRPTKKN